eukprot:gb/GECH01001973.1/.p1 GENE.gb/GECH01001973.1/~~gb/GECH01001973.1/.p1  ORF type:complete len:336 (+),score=70.77 gb/GECH01001973.1/:1-1008(+)
MDHSISTVPPNVSCIEFCGSSTVACGTWDNTVCFWRVQGTMSNVQTTPITKGQHRGPVLDLAGSKYQNQVLSASCDGSVLCWDLERESTFVLGQHDKPVSTVNYIEDQNLAMSGSWDASLRFWDLRNGSCTHHIDDTVDRVFAASTTAAPLIMAATAERHLLFWDLRHLAAPVQHHQSPLRMQSRAIAGLGSHGVVVGDVCGRMAVLNPMFQQHAFITAHRTSSSSNPSLSSSSLSSSGTGKIHPIHDIQVNPAAPSQFASTGGDGTYCVWDTQSMPGHSNDTRSALYASRPVPAPMVSCGFNSDGSLFAYGAAYDWQGLETGSYPESKIWIHIC